MKNLMFFCFTVIVFASCNKNCDDGNVADTCLDAKLEEYKASDDAKTIQTQTVDGETYYWLNTDARTFDGVEYILGENCDTACVFGGLWQPQPCVEVFNWENWQIIWQK